MLARIAQRRFCLTTCLWLAALPAAAVQRFPRPDFTSDYVIPATTQPGPRADWIAWLDVAVLVAALLLAGHLVLRRRSRRGAWLLTACCLAWFGFVRRGCVCPVGAVQNLALAWSDAGYTAPLVVVAFFALPLVWTLFAGRTFCAAVCPLGAVQELALWRPLKVPAWLNHCLGLLPWVFLGVALLFASTGAGFLICRWDPFVGFFRLGAPLHMVLLGAAVLGLSLFVGRPYCRYACPYGALLGVMSRFARRHVTITPSTCVQCRLCEESCPYDAIRKPVPAVGPESRATGVRRLARILTVMPLVALLAGATGWSAGRLLSRAHPEVALALDVHRDASPQSETMRLRHEAFQLSQRTEAALHAEARAIQARFAIGGSLLGALLGLIVCTKLLGLSLWRSHTDYEPDRAQCFSCARCFNACPVGRRPAAS